MHILLAAVLVIRAGHLLDVNTGKYANDQAIVINGDRIESVGPFKPIDGAKVIDLSAFTVLPAFTDCHNHFLGNPDDYSATSYLRTSTAEGTIWGIHNLQEWIDHGFTTLRDACEADTGYGQIALRDGIAKGLVRGPRIFAAGSCVSITGGHGDANALAADQPLPRRPNLADSVDEVATVVRRDLKYGADWIKLMGTGGILDPYSDYTRQELSDEQMAKAVEVAHRAGRKVMVHAEGTVGIKAAVRAGVDSIEHGTMLDEEGAALMEQKGTWLVPTLFTFQYGAAQGEKLNLEPVMLKKVRTIINAQAPAFKRALDHHVKIAFGLDLNPKFLPNEFESLVKGGMTPLQAIQTATINAAELLGVRDDLGSITKGKYADIIAVRGDPLADIKVLADVPFVMKAGVVMKDEGRTPMIMRVWHGFTTKENADAYDDLLRREVLPGIHRIDGYLGSWLLRRDAGNEVEFVTITTWDSWDAIKRFAPDGKSVIHPVAGKLLTHADEHSVHYDGTWVP